MDEKRFIADSMVGRLAKWLRTMGYDTHYQPRYSHTQIEDLLAEGRVFLTRKRQWVRSFPSAIFLESDHVGEQIRELKRRGLLASGPLPFTRCIRCNSLLIEADPQLVSQHVPDYVLYKSGYTIKQCPSCKRYYWPGTHRDRMERQLRLWGVSQER